MAAAFGYDSMAQAADSEAEAAALVG